MELNSIRNKSWEDIISILLEQFDDITEIEANGTTSLFIKKNKERIEIKNVFKNQEDYTSKLKNLIKIVDQKEDARFVAEGRLILSTGEVARCHILLPPATYIGQVTIAKKSKNLKNLSSLIEKGSMSKEISDFLIAAVNSNLTIVFSGVSGSGKTTILEAMSRYFKKNERIAVVEDLPELSLDQSNVTYSHSTVWSPGTDLSEVATLSWCVQQVNRSRVDKIIIGELRGVEFSDFLIAANSGMEGSMTTIHANSPTRALEKMTQFLIMGAPQPLRSANQSIANTIDIIVQLGFNKEGHNIIQEIVEVTKTLNMNETANITTQSIFSYNNSNWKRNYLSDRLVLQLKEYGYNKDFKTSNLTNLNFINKRK